MRRNNNDARRARRRHRRRRRFCRRPALSVSVVLCVCVFCALRVLCRVVLLLLVSPLSFLFFLGVCSTAALSFFVAEKRDRSIKGRYVCFLWRSINTVIYNRDHICSRHIQKRQKKTKYEIKTKHQDIKPSIYVHSMTSSSENQHAA